MSVEEIKLTYSLTFKEVIDILRMIDECPFRELRLELGDLKVHLVRAENGTAAGNGVPPVQTGWQQRFAAEQEDARQQATTPLPSATADSGKAADAPSDRGVPVTAPLAGTFYRAPAPGEPPFVEVGSRVKAGDVVGIIEVMKLMNHIKAPCAGVVREILAQNEQFVEFGQVLAYIDPSARE